MELATPSQPSPVASDARFATRGFPLSQESAAASGRRLPSRNEVRDLIRIVDAETVVEETQVMHIALLKHVAGMGAHLRFRRQTSHSCTADGSHPRERFGREDEVAVPGGRSTTVLIEAHDVEVELATRIVLKHERRGDLHARMLAPDQGK